MGTKVYASGMNYGAVTPSDTTALDFQAVYIGVAGNVAISSSDSATAVTFTGVTAGSILPIKGKRIMATNTTSTNMVWLSW
tara:strand:- start:294 stop:536 length:243 start_codon:yes stop_codon:yes gene_type:complete